MNQKVQQHEKTKYFLNQVQTALNGELSDKNGDINKVTKSNYEEIGLEDFNYPTYRDFVTGLGIIINALWAIDITLIEYQPMENNQYQAKVKIKLYDHFGLGEEDVSPGKGAAGKDFGEMFGFQAWFILQHDKDYGYPPLLTEMEFEYSFEGAYEKQLPN